MAETGILGADEQVQLLARQIIQKMPKGAAHSALYKRVEKKENWGSFENAIKDIEVSSSICLSIDSIVCFLKTQLVGDASHSFFYIGTTVKGRDPKISFPCCPKTRTRCSHYVGMV